MMAKRVTLLLHRDTQEFEFKEELLHKVDDNRTSMFYATEEQLKEQLCIKVDYNQMYAIQTKGESCFQMYTWRLNETAHTNLLNRAKMQLEEEWYRETDVGKAIQISQLLTKVTERLKEIKQVYTQNVIEKMKGMATQ